MFTKTIIQRRIKNIEAHKSALHNNASEFQASILSKRDLTYGTEISDFLNPSISAITSTELTDSNKAATRISRAIAMNEVIAIACDFNPSSISCAITLYSSLVRSFGCQPHRVCIHQSERQKNGTGITSNVLRRIQDSSPAPTLIISASMEEGNEEASAIKEYNNLNVSNENISDLIIINNIHKMKKVYITPFALVRESNTQQNCLSGTVISLILMNNVRDKLIQKNIRKKESIASIGAMLPLAAVATMTESKPISNPTNRAFVKAGVNYINNSPDACWKVITEHYLQEKELITAKTINSVVAPILNSASRMGKNALLGIKFFLSTSENEAKRYLHTLTKFDIDKTNHQQSLFNTAASSAAQQVSQGIIGICTYQSNYEYDVHAEVARGIALKHSKPVIFFAPKSQTTTHLKMSAIDDLKIDIFSKMATFNQVDIGNENYIEVQKKINRYSPTFALFSTFSGSSVKIRDLELAQATEMTRKNLFKGMKKTKHEQQTKFGKIILDLTSQTKPVLTLEGVDELIGTAISVKGLSLTNIFNDIISHNPNLMSKSSYYDAGKITVKIDDFERFKIIFNHAVEAECIKNNICLESGYYSDGEIPLNRTLDLSLVDEINQLQPFGQSFEAPAFEFKVLITSIKRIHLTNHYTIGLKWERNGFNYEGYWENFESSKERDQINIGDTVNALCEVEEDHHNTRNRTIRLNIIHIIR